MKKVAIIGFGRFGKTLYRLLRGDFNILIFDTDQNAFRGVALRPGDRRALSAEDAFSASIIFYAVPISSFKKTLLGHKKLFRADHLLIDVLSVKEHPARVFREVLKNTPARAMLAHPMFGPDSSKNGFNSLPLILNRLTATAQEFQFWKKYFIRKGLRAIEMMPNQHDRLAANSQGVAHFVGRMLAEIGLKPTSIDSLGAKKLLEVKEQACHDTSKLFFDLQNYNSHTKAMRARIGRAYERLNKNLLSRKIRGQKIIFGIQGGKGSFNEQAILDHIKKNGISDYKIKYLYTTERVLKQLNDGSIDLGIFAIQNAVGGIVDESVAALSKYNCKIEKELSVLIRHCLMKRKDNQLRVPGTIMAHDQVFKQCQKTLKKKYPGAKLITGKGDMIDTAKAAQALADGKISKNIFILGSRRLAELYDLKMVSEDLQDNSDNLTTFLLVSRT